MIFRPIFADRADAGRRLAAALSHLAITHPLVLALPRGGVPVAFEVARALGADLDLLLVRKLGVPGHPELGLGAVVDGAEPQLVLNDILIRTLALTPDYIEAELRRQLIEINRRRSAYLGDRVPPPMTGRTVIIVDDGIATGGTMKAALRGARKNRPARLVLAVPVAPREALTELESECDELVCLAAPDPFYAVGAHYGNFDQTSDAEVMSLLAKARIDGRATLTD
ncbi:MAG: phosphoribosyltransferase [Sphingomonas sp. 66-10]|uniref:phosphoribosyltransferase n=1 Tax=Sphingomonas sp. 66-10 TaxID=1895848 RepID=UPI000929F98A|nr:phosphoribosyltransferase [Sphingomonas sp. 66-10]OJU22394.1 MAG: phosphoribosyltransferase [Sphingomonas sp. 66-10]